MKCVVLESTEFGLLPIIQFVLWSDAEEFINKHYPFYTKSFKFFLQLDDNERKLLNGMMKKGIVAMSLSLDDTTDEVQRIRYGRMRKTYPLANTYYATDDIGSVKYDSVCKCANCAKCGNCIKATGKVTVCQLHSVTEKQIKQYKLLKTN